MTTASLGRLEQVDLSEAWINEAGHFTPWLAKPENLALLGDAIGIELECETQEKAVGPYRADILCRDTSSGSWVVIENQLEKTDHGHLGQLLTYAAGLKAVTVVWIAQRFTEEHRAALDWLNEITDERFNFFGLEIELWRIGNSEKAPKFNIVSKPNGPIKLASGRTPRDGGLQRQQYEYWAGFVAYLKDKGTTLRVRNPPARNWMDFSVGRTDAWLSVTIYVNKDAIWMGLCCQSEGFVQLKEQQEVIESELGQEVSWDEEPGRKAAYIGLRRDADLKDRDKWPEQFAWLKCNLEAFEKAFRQRVQDLDTRESGESPNEV